MADLFGRYCYIDTPWIAGKRTRYRIIGSGVSSNAWCEVPVTGRTELIHHDNTEEVVFVVLDTLVSDDSIIRRFALKDVELIPAEVRPVLRGQWKPWDLTYGRSIYACTSCGESTELPVVMGKPTYQYCPNCGADMRGGDAE